MKKAIAQMIQSLLLSLAARSQLQELREKLRSPVVDKGPVLKAKPPAAQKDILGVCSDPLVLAQQLTHIELVSDAIELVSDTACSGFVWSGVGPHLAWLSQWVLQRYFPAGQSGPREGSWLASSCHDCHRLVVFLFGVGSVRVEGEG